MFNVWFQLMSQNVCTIQLRTTKNVPVLVVMLPVVPGAYEVQAHIYIYKNHMTCASKTADLSQFANICLAMITLSFIHLHVRYSFKQ